MQVEFAFGVFCAALYGASAEYISALTTGFGNTYSAVLFTGASGIVLPAIRFVRLLLIELRYNILVACQATSCTASQQKQSSST